MEFCNLLLCSPSHKFTLDFLFSPQQENPFASERIKRPDNLPQDRTAYTGDVFTVDKSSVGFLTYQEVVDILSERESEGKDVWTAEVVAKKYQIEPTEAANLMKYFSAYRQPTPNPPPRL